MVARETEELSLLAPVMRQVLAQPQEPRRRQLDWLTALKERARNVRAEIGQSNKRSEVALAHSEVAAIADFLHPLGYRTASGTAIH
jgi:hypothetical protein